MSDRSSGRDGPTQSNYRRSHLGAEKAESYSSQFDDKTNYKWLFWQIEKELLSKILNRHAEHARSLLDFACGSGRLLSFLGGRFDRATGIDVSRDMLAKAGEAAPTARLVCGDVSRGEVDLVQPSDVIVAFRFFLNAEPELGRQVLEWMHSNLSDHGLLVCNFHMSPFSLAALHSKLRSWITRSPATSTMSRAAARRLLANSGFEVVDLHAYGYFLYRRSGVRRPGLMLRIERLLARSPIRLPFARNFILVAAKQ